MNNTHPGNWLVIAALLTALGGCAGSPDQESTGEYIDDSVITTRVRSAMIADKEVSASNISVETFKGTVQLAGFASSAKEADKAESIARNVKGVKQVKNSIQIR